jgi:hypothetical protein
MPHECYVVAKVPPALLQQALERRVGAFTDRGEAEEIDRDGTYLGEHLGATYLFDGEMLLAMGASPDLFANLSAELSTVVVACGYETVSGSYTFLACENGKLVRFFSTSVASRQPMTMGTPLAFEAKVPLSTVQGIHAGLASFGLDVGASSTSASMREVVFPEDTSAWTSEDGPLGLRAAHAAHEKEHGIPFEQWTQQFQPRVVVTQAGDPHASFVMKDGSAGFRLEMQPQPAAPPEETPKESWYERVRGWFGGPRPSAPAPSAPVGRTLDVSRLFPLVVPAGYLPGDEMARVALIDGLEVVFGEDEGGLVRYARTVDLAASQLAIADAQRVSLENLTRAARRGDVRGGVAMGDDGKPKLIVWGRHWLAATSLLLPGLLGMAQSALGEAEVCAAIPHRDAMLLFALRDEHWRASMQKTIDANESDGRRPITRRLLRLLPTGSAPYYERLPFAYVP